MTDCNCKSPGIQQNLYRPIVQSSAHIATIHYNIKNNNNLPIYYSKTVTKTKIRAIQNNTIYRVTHGYATRR